MVLCAGAVHTPHLLQLSGIGDGDTLRHHDVPVRAELSGVGQNLQVETLSFQSQRSQVDLLCDLPSTQGMLHVLVHDAVSSDLAAVLSLVSSRLHQQPRN